VSPLRAFAALRLMWTWWTGWTLWTAADVRRTGGPKGSNIKAQGERSEALGEAYNNFEPRQG
jgi:hypothetical protein